MRRLALPLVLVAVALGLGWWLFLRKEPVPPPMEDWLAEREAPPAADGLRSEAGRDVSLVAYDNAMHAFDVPLFAPPRRWTGIFNAGACLVTEQPDQTFVTDDGRPLTAASP